MTTTAAVAGNPRRPVLLAAALALSAALPALATAPAAPPASDSYVVTVAPGQLGGLVGDLRTAGVDVTRTLRSVGVVVVEASTSVLRDLRADARVAGVVADGGVRLQTGDYDAAADASSMYNVTSTIGARVMWEEKGKVASYTGRSIDVALLDSGVSRVPGLDGTGKVLNGADLSFDSQRSSTRYLDGFGHGTHMAGIIAGRDTDADPKRAGQSGPFMGVAPDARVVNVKVADAYGNADVSQIIAGIDWVVKHRKDPGLNIRVLNLSLGTPSTQSYLVDPLAHAAEQAWRKGIVVVVAVGNDGTGTGRLLNPAAHPRLLAVGANDSKGTNSTNDDVIPAFSTRGDGVRNPDLVAPGASIQSLRVPGSYIDQQFPAGRVDDRFFRGSGTSQAAAVVSGAAALVLEQRPWLTPDEVKWVLMDATRALPSADVQAQGRGMVELRRVSDGLLGNAEQGVAKAKGTGSLHAARGGFTVETSSGVALTGERDIFGKDFVSATMASKQEAESAWSGGYYNSSRWSGSGWGSTGWSAASWGGTDWTGQPWSTRLTSGATWTGRMWADSYWHGRMWAGRMWAGRMWATGSWR